MQCSSDNAYCGALKSIELPASLTTIKRCAFYYCTALTDVTIPAGVTTIEGWAFYGCSGLTSIEIPANVTDFGTCIFENTAIYVPQGSLAAYKAADEWKNFANIQEFDVTGIDGTDASDVAIKVTANGIILPDADGKTVAVYSANGALVEKVANYATEEITLNKGVYVVRVGNKTLKVKL